METTDMMIEQIVGTLAGPMSSSRQTHYLRESLRHLVRAAKSEHAWDVKRCVALSIAVPSTDGTRKSKTAARQFMATLSSGQGKFDFKTHTPE